MFRIFRWIDRSQPFCYHGKIRFRLLHSDSRLQVPEHPPVLLKRPGNNSSRRRPARLGRNPHVRIPPPKSRRHNPDQRPRYTVQYKRLIHDPRIGSKALHPRLVAQHEYRGSSRFVIGWLHHPPEERRHTQKLEGSRRDEVSIEALCPLSSPVQHVRLVIRNRSVKHMILFHVIQKLRPGVAPSPAWLTPFGVMDLDGKVPLG